MSFDNPEAPTFCPTCESELPPKTEISYFAQFPLCPAPHDLEFGAELLHLLNHMHALFDTVGSAENMEEDTRKSLGLLGADVATEAKRRWQLFDGTVRALNERANKAAALVAQLAAK